MMMMNSSLPSFILLDAYRRPSQVNGWGYNGFQEPWNLKFIPHRLDGPAIERIVERICINGYTQAVTSVKREYWIHGQQMTPQEYEDHMMVTHLSDYHDPKPFVFELGGLDQLYEPANIPFHVYGISVFGFTPSSAYKLKTYQPEASKFPPPAPMPLTMKFP